MDIWPLYLLLTSVLLGFGLPVCLLALLCTSKQREISKQKTKTNERNYLSKS